MSTLTLEQQATNYATMRHIERVRNLLDFFATQLLRRGVLHDQSKLASPEVEAFTEFTPKLATTTYGSQEYKGFLKEMGPALDHHYAKNRHHPEHFAWHCPVCQWQGNDEQHEHAPQGPNESGARYCPRCCSNGMLYESELMFKPEFGINGMDLLDLVEMFCDWKAAGERHNDGNILKSIEKNTTRFGLSPQLVRILQNTAAALEA